MNDEQFKKLQDIISNGPALQQAFLAKYGNHRKTFTEDESREVAQRKATSTQFLQKAFEYALVGNMYLALFFSNKAISLNPDSIEARVARGAVYAKLGEMDDAFTDTLDSLNLNPIHQEAKLQMSNLLVFISKQHIFQNRPSKWLESLLLARRYNPGNRVVDELLAIGQYNVCIADDDGQATDEFCPPSLKLVTPVYNRIFSDVEIRKIRERYREEDKKFHAVAQDSPTPSTSQANP